ncbi:hypothetical protein L596_029162 [Steinernema carpocapsae]|uniref:Major facilitator superfamily (MFS) profile domain-containing protein n=1 Tax=Steinernema carpocapsae TaxID=34508 RepID=A0A4U5LTU6_STECR|nr:hypothetical protein L596_029162 [Steinernema carpocapsae]
MRDDIGEDAFENSTSTDPPLSSSDESILFAILSVGRILATYPALKLRHLIGFKASFTLFGISSAFGTVIAPVFGSQFYPLLLFRFIQGFAVAAAFIAIATIPNVCGNENELHLFTSLLTCSFQLGPVLIMPISGLFCSSFLGWQGAYYMTSVGTLLFSLIFYFSYDPNDFAKQQKVERRLSTASDIGVEVVIKAEANESVPYFAILTCPSFWGLMAASFGDTVGYHMFRTYGPIYLNKVLGFDITDTGMLASIPYFLSIFTKAIGGYLLDNATCSKEHVRITVFTSFFQATMTGCFVVLSLIHSDMAFIGHAMLTLMMVFSGLAFIGIMNGSRIMSQQYSHVTSSAISVLDSLAALVLPIIVAFVAPNYEPEEWILVFYIVIGMMVTTNLIFVLMTKVKPAKWTKPSTSNTL